MKRAVFALLCLLLSAVTDIRAEDGPAPGSPPVGAIWVTRVEGAIGPATSDYLIRALESAAAHDAELVVVTMDTPGGLDNSMRDIIQAILASPVPVATFVYPQGARAASAGTYILYASHVAAMAPATNLGAATPVQLGAPPVPAPQPVGTEEEQPAPAPGGSVMERKMTNDAIAYIRGLAELRGRNADWAEDAVRMSESLSSKDAADRGVIDFVAQDVDDLLAKIDGLAVTVDSGQRTISTSGREVYQRQPDWRTEFLKTITNPNLVLILGMIGIYGLILEFYNPGVGVPGVVGAICLLLAGYALQMLPVNYAGLAFILLGVGLMVAEAMAPSFGIMGFGGIVSFVIGAIILIDTDVESFQIGTPVIAAVAVVSALFLILTLSLFMRVRKNHVVTGVELIVGEHAEVLQDFESQGQVRIEGEIWRAVTDTPLAKGDIVKVTSVKGLNLTVEKEDTA